MAFAYTTKPFIFGQEKSYIHILTYRTAIHFIRICTTGHDWDCSDRSFFVFALFRPFTLILAARCYALHSFGLGDARAVDEDGE